MTTFQCHQGDVLIEETTDEPTGKPVQSQTGRHILAHGEQTGHHHSISANRAVMFRDDGLASTYSAILDIGDGASLEHQEHAPVAIPVKRIGVILQSVYEPSEIRQVQD